MSLTAPPGVQGPPDARRPPPCTVQGPPDAHRPPPCAPSAAQQPTGSRTLLFFLTHHSVPNNERAHHLVALPASLPSLSPLCYQTPSGQSETAPISPTPTLLPTPHRSPPRDGSQPAPTPCAACRQLPCVSALGCVSLPGQLACLCPTPPCRHALAQALAHSRSPRYGGKTAGWLRRL